jgi:hypothetical protein
MGFLVDDRDQRETGPPIQSYGLTLDALTAHWEKSSCLNPFPP